jgi:2-iminobutanoate/2-iminopropanoate deaminase
MRRKVTSNSVPVPAGAYSQGIVAGGFLFLAGQGPFDAEGTFAGSSITAQVHQVMTNLATVAAEAGASLENAVRISVYLSDLRHFQEMDAAYREFVPEVPPVRTTIQSDLIGFDVEADAIIWLGDAAS